MHALTVRVFRSGREGGREICYSRSGEGRLNILAQLVPYSFEPYWLLGRCKREMKACGAVHT